MYGWRGRVGMVNPSRGDTLIYEFYKAAPEGLVVVPAALGVQRVAADQLTAILDRYEAAVQEMVYEECDVIVVGGSPPVLSGPPGTEERLLAAAQRAASMPVFLHIRAEVEAVQATGARRIALGAPYPCAITEKWQAYFEAQSIEVVASHTLDIERNIELAKLPPYAAYRVAREVFERAGGAVDAVHLTCPRWPTLGSLERLEQDLGVPVTSSSQSVIYGVLRRLRIHDRIDGYGSLLVGLARGAARAPAEPTPV